MGGHTATSSGQELRPAELAEALRETRSETEKIRAGRAQVAADVIATAEQAAAVMSRLAGRLPHHAERLQALSAAADGAARQWRQTEDREPGGVTFADPGSGEAWRMEAERWEVLRREFETLVRRFDEAVDGLRATREQARRGRSAREILRDSAFARLQARMETMGVIEQAKGIVMGEQRCGPEEAFELLRRASQRANVKVHVLAEQIVETVAASKKGDSVTPISLAAGRRRPG